jgi:hypothetical protein
VNLVPTASPPNAVSLPSILPQSSSLLNALTTALAVDRSVLALDGQIEHAWSNLPRLLSRIPPQHRSDTLVRMCVAVATGLFDSAINYAWNAVVVELRSKVRRFGLKVVPQVTGTAFDETSLVNLRDADLLELCLKLNLISEEGYFLLDQNRDIRNNFSVAHPSIATLDEDEFLNFLSRCGRYALSDESNPKGVDLQALLSALKVSRFTPHQLEEWVKRFRETFEAQRELLVGTLYGIYCDPTSSEETRLNAIDVCKEGLPLFTPRINSNLVDRHQEYTAKGDIDRQKASRQFFERLALLPLLGDVELHHVISAACDNLWAVHNGMNNFYNEPPFAERLQEITAQARVPESVRDKFVITVVACAIGTRYGSSDASVPTYKKLVQSFSPAEIGIMLNLPNLSNIVASNVRSIPRCAKMYQELVRLISASSVPTYAQTTYGQWISASL